MADIRVQTTWSSEQVTRPDGSIETENTPHVVEHIGMALGEKWAVENAPVGNPSDGDPVTVAATVDADSLSAITACLGCTIL